MEIIKQGDSRRAQRELDALDSQQPLGGGSYGSQMRLSDEFTGNAQNWPAMSMDSLPGQPGGIGMQPRNFTDELRRIQDLMIALSSTDDDNVRAMLAQQAGNKVAVPELTLKPGSRRGATRDPMQQYIRGGQ
jgi:hypothetical protein